jgi:hypothetical protein
VCGRRRGGSSVNSGSLSDASGDTEPHEVSHGTPKTRPNPRRSSADGSDSGGHIGGLPASGDPDGSVGEVNHRDAETRSPDRNVENVRAKLLERSLVGLKKYGVTTERKDLSRLEWLRHAQTEALDFAVYLEKLIADELRASASPQ